MRIGYPCVNLTVGCSSGRTFRLKSYSESHLRAIVKHNLECLIKILQFNLKHKIFFFRITSDLIPFASHPINTVDWQEAFKSSFELIGEFILRNRIRISMHPDQFTLINSIKEEIFERSEKELKYHVEVLDLMNLETSAKVQIHVGGVYGNKMKSMERFVRRFHNLGEVIRRRLVIENDDRLYNVKDCLKISSQTQIPVLFDAFHHRLNNKNQNSNDDFACITRTWNLKNDGLPMVDYSSQEPKGGVRQHSGAIDLENFDLFLKSTEPFDFDIMLELKDKEKSAIKAIKWAASDQRVRSFLLNS